jgi:hypothetical protein
MKKKDWIISLFLICFSISYSSFGQQNLNKKPAYFNQKNTIKGTIRCATTENEIRLQVKNPNRMVKTQFEDWLAPILETQKKQSATNKTAITTYTVPVVIHIIHDGDAVNTIGSHASENISDAQAASQITVLNQDFRKIVGSPGFGTTGYNRGVDCLINFVLAKQDPNGVLTTGIERINMGKTSWNETEIDALVKPETQWDPTKYLNIWIVNFSTNLLGYAQFPSNSNLVGLDSSGGDAATDGVVVNYNAFGTFAEDDSSFELNPKYNKGRTATHEIGHFLGLRHIWGDDDSCTGNDTSSGDYVSDTPDSNIENYGCPTISNCTGNDMVENYMDYTDDDCMNTFTAGQKSRMIAVMSNSPRRKELATSKVATPGFSVNLDAALKNIFINTSDCNASFSPSINIENKGNTAINTVTLTYTIDNKDPKTYVWNGNLAQNTAGLITIPEITTSTGAHVFSVAITTLNNATDLNVLNDTRSNSFYINPLSQLIADTTPKVTLILQCDRDGSETTWTLKNSLGVTVYSGGPYEDATSSTKLKDPISEVFNLQDGACYTFTINDSYGDGINTNGGLGSYTLYDENNAFIASGSTFQFNESKSFTFGNELNTTTFENTNQIFLYPNPTKDFITISIPNFLDMPDRYYVTNIQGKIILKKEIVKQNDLTIPTSSLSEGIYFVSIEKGTAKHTLKFIKE